MAESPRTTFAQVIYLIYNNYSHENYNFSKNEKYII